MPRSNIDVIQGEAGVVIEGVYADVGRGGASIYARRRHD